MSSYENTFRWDIQGLRAIAVLAIVIFHISPYHLPGGYIGVDIFFVISGYLIIGHIWRDLNKGTFRLFKFYSRRAKRLIPAFFVMTIGTSIGAYYLFLPDETSNYVKSLIASLFYVSNYFFYADTDSNYFNTAVEFSSLLHTWSLAVEEQFYILFPLILALLFRIKPRILFWGLLAIAVVSFAFSELLLTLDKQASFYFAPSRFWQFILGGLISIKLNSIKIGKYSSDFLSLSGLLVLSYCLFSFNKDTPFPGINASIPSLATALIIFAGVNPNGYVYKVLSFRLLKFFGNISYSLYLWHWPVIVFYKLAIDFDPSLVPKLYMLTFSILLGYLSWKYIENFKWNVHSSSKLVNPVTLSVSMSLIFSLVALFAINGLPFRYSEKQIAYASYLDYDTSQFRPGTCFLNGGNTDFKLFNKSTCIQYANNEDNILLIGDSHAAHWYSAFNKLLDQQHNISQVTSIGCKPTIAYSYLGDKWCTDLIAWAYEELIPTHRFDKIILSARWKKKELPHLIDSIKRLAKYTEEIIILGPIIEYKRSLPTLLALYDTEEEISINREYNAIKEIDDYYAAKLSETSARYLSILNVICATEISCTTVTDTDIPMQFDYGHLTHHGGITLLNRILETNLL